MIKADYNENKQFKMLKISLVMESPSISTYLGQNQNTWATGKNTEPAIKRWQILLNNLPQVIYTSDHYVSSMMKWGALNLMAQKFPYIINFPWFNELNATFSILLAKCDQNNSHSNRPKVWQYVWIENVIQFIKPFSVPSF